MPIYEYECLDEKHRFEIIQKFSDPPVTHCTVCGCPVQRVISAAAIQFKGSGWYITDYARKGSSQSESSSSSKSDSSSSEKSTETKSETKSSDSSTTSTPSSDTKK